MKRKALLPKKTDRTSHMWEHKVSSLVSMDVPRELSNILTKRLKVSIPEKDLAWDTNERMLYSPSTQKVYLFRDGLRVFYATCASGFDYYPCEDETLWPFTTRKVDTQNISKDTFCIIGEYLSWEDYYHLGKTCKRYYNWWKADGCKVTRLEKLTKLSFSRLQKVFVLVKSLREDPKNFREMTRQDQRFLLKSLFQDEVLNAISIYEIIGDPSYHIEILTRDASPDLKIIFLRKARKNFIIKYKVNGHWNNHQSFTSGSRAYGNFNMYQLFQDNIGVCLTQTSELFAPIFDVGYIRKKKVASRYSIKKQE